MEWLKENECVKIVQDNIFCNSHPRQTKDLEFPASFSYSKSGKLNAFKRKEAPQMIREKRENSL